MGQTTPASGAAVTVRHAEPSTAKKAQEIDRGGRVFLLARLVILGGRPSRYEAPRSPERSVHVLHSNLGPGGHHRDRHRTRSTKVAEQAGAQRHLLFFCNAAPPRSTRRAWTDPLLAVVALPAHTFTTPEASSPSTATTSQGAVNIGNTASGEFVVEDHALRWRRGCCR